MGKHSRSEKNKALPLAPPPLEVEKESGSMTMFPLYVPPRWFDVPRIRVLKNAQYPLVAPTVLEGVQVWQKILLNLKKLTFVDHEIRTYPYLDMNNYTVLMQDTPDILK